MRINHNIAALNASNSLKSNNNAITKNLQKLSSGYRINSAADDAAGLAVSEKMRAQINGLNQAEDNAQNGISLVQTAEGGLNETESILQRMNTLAVESSNGTYQDGTDRANLQKEVTALQKEVDRISTSTNFNGINLLDGSLGGGTSGAVAATLDVAGATAVTVSAATASTFAGTVAVAADTAAGTVNYTVSYKTADGSLKSDNVSLSINATGTDYYIYDAAGNKVGGGTTASALTTDAMAGALKTVLSSDKNFTGAFSITQGGANTASLEFKSNTLGTTGEQIVGITKNGSGLAVTAKTGTDAYQSITVGSAVGDQQVYDGTNAAASIFTVNGQKFAFVASTATNASALGSDVNTVYLTTASADTNVSTQMSNLINSKTGLLTTVASGTQIDFKGNAASATNGNAVVFQIGSDNKADQRVSLSIGDMSTKGLKITGVSVATKDDAKAAIDTIKNAVNMVSASRADLGALQNRLEHTTNNLSTMSQNLTSAESTIRDVDMSSEMVDLTKNQILEQAATSMLAQANSLPQSVLSLLKG